MILLLAAAWALVLGYALLYVGLSNAGGHPVGLLDGLTKP